MKGRSAPIEILNIHAQEFDYREATVLMLFNPFGPSTVEAVLEQIRISARSHPIRIAYVNSVYDEIFSTKTWLQRVEHWDKHKMNIEHSTTFYKSLQP
jgi:hypothetical protein